MMKSCSKCGKIHDSNFKCTPKTYNGGNERNLRSTYKWTQKSKQVRDDANWLCEYCRDKGIIEYRNIEVHHIDKLKDAGAGVLLDDTNLICLCQEHHKMADAGQIPKDVLREIASRRIENRVPPGKKIIPPH